MPTPRSCLPRSITAATISRSRQRRWMGRRRHESADRCAVSDARCREVAELQGADALRAPRRRRDYARQISADRSAALGQRARERRRRGHVLHRHRRFGGCARHRICARARRPAIRGGAGHVFGRPARRGAPGADRVFTLGGWTVRNLPVAMLPLRQLSQGLGAKRVDGILGTTLFYHFLATLDFPNGDLVLRRKNAASLARSRHRRATASPFRSGWPAIISWSAGVA